MNNFEEIKSLIKRSKVILNKELNEDVSNIKKQYGILSEAISEKNKIDDSDGPLLDKEKKDSDEIGVQKDKQKTYRILGNLIVLHGKKESDLQITTDEKNAFTSSVDEFRTDVAELVEFGKLNVFSENVEWTGKLLESNLEFFYTVNESDVIYINGQMIKIDQNYLLTISKLQSYYQKFKNKWSKIVASRQEDTEK